MPKLELWHKVMLVVVLMFGGYFFCEARWEESREISDVKFLAMTNQERYLIDKLDKMCQKYGFHKYPCPVGRMSAQDKVNYKQMEDWYKAQQQDMKKFFGGG